MIPDAARSLTAEALVESDPKTGQAAQLRVTAEQLVPAAESLVKAGYFLEDVSGLDVQEGFELTYHFDHMDKPGRITLRLVTPHDEAKVPSLANLISAADWHERETWDFFRVEFEGHPNLKPLLLVPGDEPPLLKDPKKRMPACDVSPAYPQPEPEPDEEGDAEDKKAEAKAKAKEKAAAKAKEKAEAKPAEEKPAEAKPADEQPAESDSAPADKQEGADQ
ncbi:MAG: NADH-quinone oxidoreductase subunit C [Desulfovibrionaceae bacterium]